MRPTVFRALWPGASSRLVGPTVAMYRALGEGIEAGPTGTRLASFDDGVADTTVHMAMLRSIVSGRPRECPAKVNPRITSARSPCRRSGALSRSPAPARRGQLPDQFP